MSFHGTTSNKKGSNTWGTTVKAGKERSPTKVLETEGKGRRGLLQYKKRGSIVEKFGRERAKPVGEGSRAKGETPAGINLKRKTIPGGGLVRKSEGMGLVGKKTGGLGGGCQGKWAVRGSWILTGEDGGRTRGNN